jgi:hypothetical protein
MFENRALRRIFEFKTKDVSEDGENCIEKSFSIFTQLLGRSNQGG